MAKDLISSFSPPGTLEASKPHFPTVKDVLKVQDILGVPKPRLPLEIIDVIIDFAEYWPHVAAKMEEELVAEGSTDKENIECLRTPPLCFDMSKCEGHSLPPLFPSRTIHPCRKIVFSISSQDQGWGGSQGYNGPDVRSYTWFDAVCEPWLPPNAQPPEPKHPFLSGPKTLQHNVLVHPFATRHEITWSYLDTLDTDPEVAEKLAAESGRGKETMNGEFVRNMKAGDSVVLWARARFPGWENVVHDAEVKVFWAV